MTVILSFEHPNAATKISLKHPGSIVVHESTIDYFHLVCNELCVKRTLGTEFTCVRYMPSTCGVVGVEKSCSRCTGRVEGDHIDVTTAQSCQQA